MSSVGAASCLHNEWSKTWSCWLSRLRHRSIGCGAYLLVWRVQSIRQPSRVWILIVFRLRDPRLHELQFVVVCLHSCFLKQGNQEPTCISENTYSSDRHTESILEDWLMEIIVQFIVTLWWRRCLRRRKSHNTSTSSIV